MHYRLLPVLCVAAVVACSDSQVPAAAALDYALQPPLAEGTRLIPRGDGRDDATFNAFMRRLTDAASARDTTYLESVLDPDVKVSFGPDGTGVGAFRNMWRPRAQDSALWTELHTISRLPASKADDGTYWIPYVYAQWPRDVDPHTHAAVTAEDVLLRDKPSADASALARLSYHIVRVVESGSPTIGWTRVAVSGSMQGYIPSSMIARASGLRLQCTRSNGEWRITVLIAGD
jgi:hypothetical protein